MTVRQFIQMLLEECENLDGLIDVYVCAKVGDIKPRIEDADDDNDYWCIDDNLDIREIEDMGGYYHIHVDQIEYR